VATNPIGLAAHGSVPALTLTRINTGNFGAKYLDLANGYAIDIQHSNPSDLGVKKETHYVRLTETKNVTLPSGSVVKQSAFISISATIPPNGWTLAQKVELVASLYTLMGDADFGTTDFISYVV